jgi:hypothetical protein
MWSFAKNQKHRLLKFIKGRLEASQQQVNKVQFYLGGRELQIQKKVKRCFVSTIERYQRKFFVIPWSITTLKFFQVQRSKTPPGLMIITPRSEPYMKSVRTRELPWFYFLQELNLNSKQLNRSSLARR